MQIEIHKGVTHLIPKDNDVSVMIAALDVFIKTCTVSVGHIGSDPKTIANKLITSLRTIFEH